MATDCMRIFLIGYMGSGKSSVGAELARRLQLSFTDLDRRVEEAEGSTIATIFATQGEAYFRALETQQLHSFLQSSSSGILAAGGGTPCFNANMDEMNAAGMTIYLRCSAETLRTRLEGSTHRPMIKQPEFSLENHLGEREKHYRRAQHTINNDGEINEAVEAIVQLITGASPSA